MEASERTPELLWLLMALMLPLTALLVRRIPLGQVFSMLLIWAAIFGAGFAAFRLVEPRFIAWQQSQRGGTIVGDTNRLGSVRAGAGRIARIPMGPDGHFWTQATLNGRPIRLLVDSGASITAISQEAAQRIGIELDGFAPPLELSTANGVVEARRATAKSLKIGAIEARDLPVVVSPAFGATSVVGMNFLGKLKSWRVENGFMILESP